MKLKLLLSFLCLICYVNSQTTLIPDPNFEQALIDFGYDTVIDGQVPTANISGVIGIDVNGRNISSLEGIEDFTSLIALRCYNNQLNTLDVSTLTDLELLWCFQNNLTSLDTSNNQALRFLFADQNDLTSLDLSSNNALIEVGCSFNQITGTLDLSGASNLTYILVRNNQLTGLNVQNGNNTNVFLYDSRFNPNLNCIQVDDIGYSVMNWTNVVNPATFNLNCHFDETFVPDNNFENALINLGYDTVLDDYVLNSNIESVTSLNVFLQNIDDLTGIEGFTALQDLNCARNNLTSLDVSQNTNLVSLNCNRNDLTQLAITDGTGTQQLNLTDLQCGDNNLTGLITNFYPNLENLNCANNDITNLNSLFANANLQSLICNNNTITNLNLNSNSALTELDVRDNQLTALSIQNGNNSNIVNFNALSNAMLTCINVDDVTYASTNWTNIDPQTSFSTNCTLSNNQAELGVQLKLFPNPTEGYLKIETSLEIESVTIFSISGNSIISFENREIVYNISSLNSGIYFVKVRTDQGEVTQKLIKK